MCAKVLHFGCGALGLGLTIPILKDLPKVEIYLSNRRSDKEQYEYLSSKKSYNYLCGLKKTVIQFDDFIFFDEFEKLKEIVLADDYLVITTALKETGIEANIELLASLISLRNQSKIRKPLLFIACENAICSSDVEKKIKDVLKINHRSNFRNPEILFLDTVVDRMCNSPVFREGELTVLVEPYCSWIINPSHFKRKLVYNDPNYIYLLDQFHNTLSEDVEFIYDLEFFRRRKKWIINSMHQILALHAHYTNQMLIHRFVRSTDGSKIVYKVANDVLRNYLFNESGASEEETIDYIKQYILRITNFPSLVSTALTRFNSEDKLPAFLTDFHRKTGEPALNYIDQTSYDLPSINHTLLMLTDMVSRKKYVGR